MSRAPRLEELPPHLRAAVEASAKARGIELRGSDSARGAALDASGDPRARRPGAAPGAAARPTIHSIQRARSGGTARKVGEPNGTEAAFDREHLAPLAAAGELRGYAFEGLLFTIAPGVRYRADYVARFRDGRVVVYELKARDKRGRTAVGRVKAHVAPVSFRWLVDEFYRVTRGPGGAWAFERLETGPTVVNCDRAT